MIRSLLILATTAAMCCGQSDPAKKPGHKSNREEYAAGLSAMSKEQLVQWVVERTFGPDLVGKKFPLPVHGKTTIAVYMWSRCPHCVVEVPYFAKLDRDSQSKYSVVPVFTADDKDAGAFLKRERWPDARVVTLSSADLKQFPLRGTPTTLILDADGIVTACYNGELSAEERQQLQIRLE
jgi:thiol-disulfide isomerase/thioredoxin